MKIMRMTAVLVEQLEYTCAVPDHWTEEDVFEYYKRNGANGEFEPVDTFWEWQDAEDLSADHSPASMRYFTDNDHTIGFEEVTS